MNSAALTVCHVVVRKQIEFFKVELNMINNAQDAIFRYF